MKLIIDISEEELERLVYQDIDKLRERIKNGVPLQPIKEQRYNQGFHDGFKKATQMANNCIKKVEEEMQAYRATDEKQKIAFESCLRLVNTYMKPH